MKSKHALSGGPEVKIIFHPRASARQLKALRRKPVGDWVVTPRDAQMYWRDTVTWRSIPPTAQIEVYLPTDVFQEAYVSGTGSVTARLIDGSGSVYRNYEAYCDGQLATGGSSPGVIVDT